MLIYFFDFPFLIFALFVLPFTDLTKVSKFVFVFFDKDSFFFRFCATKSFRSEDAILFCFSEIICCIDLVFLKTGMTWINVEIRILKYGCKSIVFQIELKVIFGLANFPQFFLKLLLLFL